MRFLYLLQGITSSTHAGKGVFYTVIDSGILDFLENVDRENLILERRTRRNGRIKVW